MTAPEGDRELGRLVAPALALLAATAAVVGARWLLEDGGNSRAVAEMRAADTRPARARAAPARRGAAQPAEAPAQTYTIRKGDTLAAVAERHDVTLPDLLAANPGVDPVALHVGQRIRLP